MNYATNKLFGGLLCLLLGIMNCMGAEAELAPAEIFTSHMLLQREQPIDVWGQAAVGAEVKVEFAGKSATAKADENGFWKATLPAMQASGPYELKISTSTQQKVFRDILIGDLWLISGQSNVVLALRLGKNWEELRKLPTFEKIRICKLPGSYSFEPTEHYVRKIKWDALNTAKAGSFLSGVGYHFIRTLESQVDVPLGLIQASAGGTQVEQWMPLEDLKKAAPENIQFGIRDKAIQKIKQDPKAKIGGIHCGAASYFNGTVYPIRYLKFAGVVWYQGEANSRVKADYRMLLDVFSNSWRKLFDEPKLPFIIVQLPGFGLTRGDGWMRLQEAQMLACGDLGFPLVVTIDQGSKVTIHPPEKSVIGQRAGLAALQHVYNKKVDGTSPRPVKITYGKGQAVVEFDAFEGELKLQGDALRGFELAAADGKYLPAEASIQGRSVTVSNPQIDQPTFVRYLWVNCPDEVNLYSQAGLPVGPFRSQALGSKPEKTIQK